ncbi:hypothetical protein K1719_038208 [Acacia pycnantha]|nr:hypothetical protein K1719_038208 [Acacia pycnantha]
MAPSKEQKPHHPSCQMPVANPPSRRRSPDDEGTEDYGTDTDFAKVLNPSDGISIDLSNPLCPQFNLEEKERERLLRPFRRTLVVKLMGRQPTMVLSLKKLRQCRRGKGKLFVWMFIRAVLHEESGREDNGGGMVFNAGGPEAKTMPVSGSGVKMHNVSGRQGRMSGVVAGKKENMKARKEQEGRAAQMGKKVVELRKERGFTGINNEELSNRVQDGVPSMKNISFVPGSNVDRFKWKEVSMTEKENLHPGGSYGKGLVNPVDANMRNMEENPIVNVNSSVGRPLAPLCLPSFNLLWSILKLGEVDMLFTAVYANPCEQRRQQVWSLLQEVAREVDEPWLVAGDFNEIKSPMEQKGGGRVNENRCHVFNEWIQQCELVDMEPKGPFFTWQGPKWDGAERVFKRLDRCLCNVKWLELFEDAEVRIIPRVGSDHHPMLVKLKREPFSFGVRRFRFELAWQMHNGFQDFLRTLEAGTDSVVN